jgi:hypothetical protein
MRIANQFIAIVFWIVGLGMLCFASWPVWGGLFLVPFALGPQFITHVGVFRAKSLVSQCILTLTLVLYFAWFVYVYIDVFYIHLDPQSAVALLFTALAVVPILNVQAFWILILLWSLVFLIELRLRVSRSHDDRLTAKPQTGIPLNHEPRTLTPDP